MRLVLLPLLAAVACSPKKREAPAEPPAAAAAAEPAPATPPPPSKPLPPLAADPGGATGAARWAVGFGGAGTDAPRGIDLDERGAVLAGLFSQTATFGALGERTAVGKSDALVLGLDERGAATWIATLGSPQDDVANAVAVRGDRVLAVGHFSGKLAVQGADGAAPLSSQGAGSDDLFAACLDRSGAAQWVWTAGGLDSDGANAVAAVSDGWLVGGSFSGKAQFGTTELVSKGGTDAVLVKLSADGDVLWVKQFGGRYNDAVWRIAADAAGNFYVQGIFADVADWGGAPLKAGGGSDNDVVLAKYDAGGNHLWSKRFGSAFNEVAGGLTVDPAGNVTMTGSFDRSVDFGAGELAVAGESDVYVARFSPAGELSWARTFGGSREDIGFGIDADGYGNVIVAGWFQQTVDFGAGPRESRGSRDVFVLKLDSAGKHVWSTTFGDTDHDQARAVAVDAAGRAWVTGIYRFVLRSGGEIRSVHAPGDRAPPPDIFVTSFER